MATRKEEAAAATGLRFLPTRRCQWHPQSEFYVSSLTCVQCIAEYGEKKEVKQKKSAYWQQNSTAINHRRKKKRDVTRAVAKLIELVNFGVEYPDAEFRVAEAFEVDAELLRAAYDAKWADPR